MASRRRYQYEWDPRTANYRDAASGLFIKEETIQQVLQQRIDDGMANLNSYLDVVLSGQADIADWQNAFALELRRAHTQMLAFGKGGWNQVTFADWGGLGRKLRDEYGFLAGFADDIAKGKLSKRQIEARMNQYANKVWQSYWQGNTSAKVQAGFTEERRVLQPAEHCDDCESLAAQGWQPIGTLPEPADGSTQCRSNCKCTKEYRR